MLFNKKKVTPLQKHDSTEELCKMMLIFFSDIFKAILAALQDDTQSPSLDHEKHHPSAQFFTDFSTVTKEEVEKDD